MVQTKKQKVDQFLADRRRVRFVGNVSGAFKADIREGLLELPEGILNDFINSKYKMMFGSHRSVDNAMYQAGLKPFNSNESYGVCRYNAENPVLAVFTNASHPQRALLHEIGHAMEFVNGDYKKLASDSKAFRKATQAYLFKKEGEMPTKKVLKGARSFRYEHAPTYAESMISSELSAELFNKFCGLQDERGVVGADNFMRANYVDAWHEYKQSVMPQIGALVLKETARHESRLIGKRLRDTLPGGGTINVGFKGNGDVRLLVPAHYSRSNLSAIVSDPASLVRRRSEEFRGKDVISIPRESLPQRLRLPKPLTKAAVQADLKKIEAGLSGNFDGKASWLKSAVNSLSAEASSVLEAISSALGPLSRNDHNFNMA